MDFPSLDRLLEEALLEDVGRGDVTTDSILQELGPRAGAARIRAKVIAKEHLVLAGWPVFIRTFEIIGPIEAEVAFKEGDEIPPGRIGTLFAHPSLLLKGERVALNLLQRASGIATLTKKYVDLTRHTGVKILDTRKTTPLLRALEKYAVRIGGGKNHRFGLDDGVLIKENHIAVAGGIKAAVQACRKRATHLQKIEVEVRDAEELREAMEAGADVILLDNMAPQQVREAVKIAGGRSLLEVSGGVREGNIVEYAETGVDFISLGALTHSSRAVDISMVFEGPV